ncbi:T9SS type A sorting domain-containing protein [Lewinella sp. IMCC34191]|uniref:T9SS type A sorting domain-containing protein n=1 Tax=Lewinella sp. IMCC34191 TaxID=2259172 RepID=UPI000E24879E|nr:T9SS type A sorting domain-containing protein [Lewinella sp. IMCC34191]
MKRILLFFPALLLCSLIFGQDGNEPNNGFSEATVVSLEALAAGIEGSIDPIGDNDYFAFEVPRAGSVIADVTGVRGGIEMEITLLGADEREILQRYGSNDGPVNLTELVCEPGMYYLRLKDRGDNETSPERYRLTVVLDTTDVYECNNSFDDASQIEFGALIDGQILGTADADFFAFEMPRAGSVVTDVTGVRGGIEMEITLFGADEREILQRYGSNDGPVNLTELVCDPGTYYLRLRDRGDNETSREPYRLTVALDTTDTYECNNNFDEAAAIEFGAFIDGQILGTADADFFAFEMPRAGSVVADVTGVRGGIEMEITLFGADEREILQRYGSNDGPVNLTELLCDPGTYYVRLRDRGDNETSREPYRLTVALDTTDTYECNNNFDEAAAIEFGAFVDGQILGTADADFFAFEVPRAGSVIADVTGVRGGIEMEITLFGADEREILQRYGSNDGPVNLTELLCDPGTYYVRLRDRGDNETSREPYRLTVVLDTMDLYECNNDFALATTVSLCDTIYASIFPQGDQDIYSVLVDNSDTVVIDFGNANPDIFISLYAYNATYDQVQLQQDQPGDPIYLIAQDSGLYYVQVIAQSNSQFSQQLYSLVFQTTEGCTTTSTNQILTQGAIRLSPNPTQNNITVTYGTQLADKQPTLRIFGADGRQLADYPRVESGRSLDLTGLPNGLLLFQFRVDGEMTTLRVVKEGR